jgi:hypothetical protein
VEEEKKNTSSTEPIPVNISPGLKRFSDKEWNGLNKDRRLEWTLLFMRYTVFLVMLMWTLDKFFNTPHARRVYEAFYGLPIQPGILYILAGLELILIVGFLLGTWKRVTYGLVLVFHGISTLSSWSQYFEPFDNLLFFAAWPMLAACVALYCLREYDTKLTVGQ